MQCNTRTAGDSRASTDNSRKKHACARVTGVTAVLNGLNARAPACFAAAAPNQFHWAFCEIGQGDGANARARACSAVAEATARGDADTDRLPTTAAPAATLAGANGGSWGGITTNRQSTRTRRLIRVFARN